MIPLAVSSVQKVGPYDAAKDATQDTTRDTIQTAVLGDVSREILSFCAEPRSKSEIAQHCGYKNSKHFSNTYLKPLIDGGYVRMTIPDKPNSKNQKYVIAGK